MSKKVKIENIIIKVGGKSIPLTLSEAKELQRILDDTFGNKTVYLPSVPVYIPWYVAPQYNVSASSSTLMLTAAKSI